MSGYRHELKYRIGYGDYVALRSRLLPIMEKDKHTDASGKYQIRSVYFDNYNDKTVNEKIDGVSQREKFRIRYYNDDFSFITLEKKIKNNNLCLKIDAPLTEAECRKILAGDTAWMTGDVVGDRVLLNEFYVKLTLQQLRPRVLVSYVREPFIFSAGNVRVTFDSNVRTTLFHGEFLTKDTIDVDTSGGDGSIILEVKFDAYLPSLIQDAIQLNSCRQTAFSKYVTCRKYGEK